MSSKSGKRSTKKTGYHRHQRKKPSYTKSPTNTSRREPSVSLVFLWTSEPETSWESLPEFSETEGHTMESHNRGTFPQQCPCSPREKHFCHECAVCSAECCNLQHSYQYGSDHDDLDQLDKETFELYFGKVPYDWTKEFGWNDLSNLWNTKKVTWSTQVTLHHCPTHSVKLDEKDYYKYRRPDGNRALSAGYAPMLQGPHRIDVHKVRPDLRAAPFTLQEININIKFQEADLPTRQIIIRSLAILELKFIPLARNHLQILRERILLDRYMQTIHSW